MEDALIRSLAEYLGCPCRSFAPETAAASIAASYREAKARGRAAGFIPILLPPDDLLLESLTMNLNGQTPGAYRREILAAPVEPEASYFAPLLALQQRMRPGMDGPEDPSDGEAMHTFFGIGGPMLLAEIPVEHPWEVFAYLPFGGWNQCPDTPGLMAAAKAWYEAYGAVPAVLTHNSVQFAVPAPADPDRALSLAWEQYAWCPDIVDQGCGTVEALAAILRQSTVWFFWWD